MVSFLFVPTGEHCTLHLRRANSFVEIQAEKLPARGDKHAYSVHCPPSIRCKRTEKRHSQRCAVSLLLDILCADNDFRPLITVFRLNILLQQICEQAQRLAALPEFISCVMVRSSGRRAATFACSATTYHVRSHAPADPYLQL